METSKKSVGVNQKMYFVDFIISLGFIIHLIQCQEYTINNEEFIKFNISEDCGKTDFCRVIFSAFNRAFILSLYKDNSSFSSATKIFIYKNNILSKFYLQNLPDATIYKGIVENMDKSIVFGYFRYELFTGKININGEVYFIEPSIYRKHSDINLDKLTVIYKLNEVVSNETYEYHNPFEDKQNQIYIHNYNKHHTSDISDDLNLSSENIFSLKTQWTCSLELLADYSFFDIYRDIATVISEMLFYAMNADFIFRNVDLNDDGKPDGIGFTIEKITLFADKNGLGNPIEIETVNSKKFLNYLYDYDHPYCMLMSFNRKNFQSKSGFETGGVKIRGSVCPHNYEYPNRKIESKGNVGFITVMKKSKSIPRFKTIMNFVHQLGHAFGCHDDPINDEICSPGDVNQADGNYIMHPKIPFGAQPNNWKFSRCCLKIMKKLFENEVDCLRRSEPVCGNGIVEIGEICDCSNSGNCSEQNCCHPKESPFQCLLPKSKHCSPATAQCCTENCEIYKPTFTKCRTCFSNELCFNASAKCDGLSPFCPGVPELDGTLCFGTSRTCKKGRCISNVCEDNKLHLCQCTSLEEQCHICCENDTVLCQSAKSLKFFAPKYGLYVKSRGSKCDDNHGICLMNGTCFTKIRSVKVSIKRKILYIIFGIILTIILISGILFFLANRPTKKCLVEFAPRLRSSNRLKRNGIHPNETNSI